MQVFVLRSQLTGNPDEVVNIVASYDDATIIDPGAHGTGATVMSLPMSAKKGMVLVNGWRTNNAPQVLAYEANVRVLAAFPDYSQRNANNELNGYIILYGTNQSTWPPEAQARKAEMDRCWNYVNSVRATYATMSASALPADPTSDSHWPARISPYCSAVSPKCRAIFWPSRLRRSRLLSATARTGSIRSSTR